MNDHNRLSSSDPRERALLVAIYSGKRGRSKVERSLDELAELADSAGAVTVERILQERDHPDPAYFVGKGKLDEISQKVIEQDIDLIIFDDNLTPKQKAKIEESTDCKVLDRTQLILDIFARRARTKEGKLQVELAQLRYLLPRLTGKGVELSRLGGGIGTRGPGETKLEMDRRQIKRRIQTIERELEDVCRHRSLHRERRAITGIPLVALVGYTNVGKSTLFNALTHADALVSNKLFATLDPLVRRIRLPNGQHVLLSDTVGFIRKLPPDLIAAFRATLEEIVDADLLLHVIDVSEDDYAERIRAVEAVLEELGVDGLPRLNVLNKVDLLESNSPQLAMRISEQHGSAVLVSALTGQGLDQLLDEITRRLESTIRRAVFLIPYDKANLVGLLHEKGKVLKEKFTQKGIRIEAEVPQALLEQHMRFVASVP